MCHKHGSSSGCLDARQIDNHHHHHHHHHQLQTHLDENNFHVKFQSAYRRGHSTETALLRILKLNADLSFDQHISPAIRSCFCHVRSLGKVCLYLTRKAANSIAVSMTLSRLDCCNIRPADLSQTQIKRLQAAQTTAARTVMKCMRSDHVMPILTELFKTASIIKCSLPHTC